MNKRRVRALEFVRDNAPADLESEHELRDDVLWLSRNGFVESAPVLSGRIYHAELTAQGSEWFEKRRRDRLAIWVAVVATITAIATTLSAVIAVVA